MWKSEIGERLVCKKDDRKEAALYDENVIGVYKQLEVDQEPEFILVGHLPMELSILMHSFLKSRDDNITDCRSNWSKRKGKWLSCTLCLPWILNFFSSGQILKKQLIKASALYKHMKIEVSGTAIIKKFVLSRTEDNKHCKRIRK